MDKGFKSAIIIWLIVISIISLSALCRTFYNDVPLEWDIAALLVGILAALCTVLIGWQIYNLIDFNKREDRNRESITKLRSILSGFKENGNRGDYILYDNLSEICENIISENTDSLKFERLHYKINAINYSSRIGEFDICEIGINIIKLFIDKYDIALKKEEQERLMKYACSIPNQHKIKNFTELINAIATIKI